MLRQWFKIDAAWVQRREAALRAEEDAVIRAARDRATGDDRAFLDALVLERERNARRSRDSR
jgi:hypothetical protein